MKRNMGIIIFILVIVLALFVSYKAMNLNDSNSTIKVVVTEYQAGTDVILKEVEVTEKTDIDNIEKIYNKLKLSPSKPMNLALVQNIVIKLDEDRVINFMEDYPNICSYQEGKETRAYVSAPAELTDWINKILNK